MDWVLEVFQDEGRKEDISDDEGRDDKGLVLLLSVFHDTQARANQGGGQCKTRQCETGSLPLHESIIKAEAGSAKNYI